MLAPAVAAEFPREVYESAPLAAAAGDWLSRGRALLRWLRARLPEAAFRETFPLKRSFNPPGAAYGYFDEAEIAGRHMELMGVDQGMSWDTSKGAAPERIRAELREFVLHYLMRVSSFRRPEDLTSRQIEERAGFGYSQHWCSSGGGIFAFPEDIQYRIVDLRRLYTDLDWLLTRVDLYGFLIRLRLLDPPFPFVEVPLPESTFLLLHRDFITDDWEHGRFGFGYVLLANPERDSVLAWGPGEFDLAVKLIEFTCAPDGAISARASFAVNRPSRILRLSADPVLAAADIAGPLTGGRFSRRTLETMFLEQHFLQHFEMLSGALTTWCQVEDWLSPERLPDWVRNGVIR